MIEVKLRVEKGKVATSYQEGEEDIQLKDIALLIYEMERIKKGLLEKAFEDDLHIEKESG